MTILNAWCGERHAVVAVDSRSQLGGAAVEISKLRYYNHSGVVVAVTGYSLWLDMVAQFLWSPTCKNINGVSDFFLENAFAWREGIVNSMDPSSGPRRRRTDVMLGNDLEAFMGPQRFVFVGMSAARPGFRMFRLSWPGAREPIEFSSRDTSFSSPWSESLSALNLPAASTAGEMRRRVWAQRDMVARERPDLLGLFGGHLYIAEMGPWGGVSINKYELLTRPGESELIAGFPALYCR